ncbi:MAG: TonB-dependent receptor [Sinimarinibacterium sp.]|jgi:outer membrane receptor protein involved in Fe transport
MRFAKRSVLPVLGLWALTGAAAQAQEELDLDTIAVPETEEAAPAQAPAPAPRPASPRGGLEIEEIVVTAQKREESANDVPIAISTFTGDTLDALGITDTRDLGVVTPGFTAADSGYNTPVYTLRGIGFNDTTYTATSTVGVYVDEVSLPYSIMTKGANIDVERVEILKGPQGTLYGRNTTGGAINYIARKPTETTEYGVTASYGSFQTTDAEGYLSGPLADTLRGRIAVRDLRSQDGWQESMTRPGDTLGRQDKQSGRAALEWRPHDDWFMRFTLDGWRDRSESQAPQAIYIVPNNPIYNPNTPAGMALSQLLGLPGTPFVAPQVENAQTVPPDSDDVRMADWPDELDLRLNDSYWGAALRSDWNMNGNGTDATTLTLIGAYGEVKSDGSTFSQSGLPFIHVEQEIFAGIRTASGEARLTGAWGEDNHWLVGVNGAFDSGDELHHVLADSVSALFPDPVTGQGTIATRFNVGGVTRARALGVFVNGDARISDTLRLTLGGRFSDEHRESDTCNRESDDSQGLTPTTVETLFNIQAAARGNPSAPVDDQDCLQLDEQGNNEKYHGELDERNLSGRVSLDWIPLDRLLLYVSYARGFKSGGFPVTNATDQRQFFPVKQEKLLALELGGKLTLFPGLLHVDFAAFDYDYTDKQLLTRFMDPTFGPLPILRNAPRSTVRGAELDFQLTPIDGLFLSAAGSYIDTRIDEFVSTTISGEENHDFAGRPFNFAPLLQYTVLADYAFPLGDRYTLGLGADYSYTGKTNSTLEGDPHYAHRDFGLTNARVRLNAADGRWTLMLWGRNVFDEFSQVSIFQAGDTIARYAGQPRTVGLSLGYRGF